MNDKISMQIEELAAKRGSFVEAVLEFAEVNRIEDIRDLTDILHPITIEKIKQEFINGNFIPALKRESSLDAFFGE